MNVTMRLTRDGMLRALRWRAHELAEDAEQGYLGEASSERRAASSAMRDGAEAGRKPSDDRPGS
ncbi:hypothetical protein [Aminobacter sp. HY435]|uniref:hypothetical protein n=1 Tax=Aminobacter sp. HY435 TaxID=2970917 RepID=UPI0022B95600|nr:hypothetical protein [Aminobacter sp. HY435]